MMKKKKKGEINGRAMLVLIIEIAKKHPKK